MTRKLDNADVNAIRREQIGSLYPQYDTAKAFDVSRKTVYNIVRGKRYANVPLPSVKTFPNYEIYPNGKVVSKRTNSVIVPRNNAVRLLDRKGNRKTIAVDSLTKLALGIK